MKNTISIFLLLILISSCNESQDVIINKHEQVFNTTADSLRKYANTPFFQALNDSSLNDYITLEFKSFKHKYKMDDSDMNSLSEQFHVTIQIVKTAASIDDNIFEIEGLNRDEN